ncbi:MAG: hypothetical protein D3910_02000, partial [Candidatus Electrothrix sp. ATG2]|nr:hypothetical protein [Candidatus Electrothrix sp. ATG2]
MTKKRCPFRQDTAQENHTDLHSSLAFPHTIPSSLTIHSARLVHTVSLAKSLTTPAGHFVILLR